MIHFTTSLLLDVGVVSRFARSESPLPPAVPCAPPGARRHFGISVGGRAKGGVAGERLPHSKSRCPPPTHPGGPRPTPCSAPTKPFHSFHGTILFLLTRALRGSDISTILQARTGIQPILSLSRARAQLWACADKTGPHTPGVVMGRALQESQWGRGCPRSKGVGVQR